MGATDLIRHSKGRSNDDVQSVAGTNVRILLADDNKEVRSALRLLLQELDGERPGDCATHCRIEEATDAQSALSCLARQPVDVVLIDWELPGLAPDRLVQEIKARCPCCIVIAMSGRPEARRCSLQLGADSFVSKSEPADRLLALLRTTQARAEAADQH
ncbi:MAG: response regulator [bacterium]